MPRIGEQSAQLSRNALTLVSLGQHILHPIECLDDSHGGTASPIETAGRCELEMDLLVAELDRLQPRVGQHLDARRNSSGEAEIIGGGHAIYDGARLVAPGNGADDRAIVGDHRLARQPSLARLVVEAPVNTAQLTCSCQPLKGFIDSRPPTEVDKIARRPNLLGIGGYSGKQPRAKASVLCLIHSVRNMIHFSDKFNECPK